MDNNLCDSGSDLDYIVRGVESEKRQGKNNFTTAFAKCSSGKSCEAKMGRRVC